MAGISAHFIFDIKTLPHPSLNLQPELKTMLICCNGFFCCCSRNEKPMKFKNKSKASALLSITIFCFQLSRHGKYFLICVVRSLFVF